MSKRRQSFEVNPHWKSIVEQHGMEEALRIFGPYKGASITPTFIDPYTTEVTMPLVESNTNYVGTHFGGSLYSMCDPFLMFILMGNLGEDYIVWDKSASIEFVKPGIGTVKAKFHIPPEEIQEIKDIVAKSRKTTRIYTNDVQNEDGIVVAKVQKELYIRLSPRPRVTDESSSDK